MFYRNSWRKQRWRVLLGEFWLLFKEVENIENWQFSVFLPKDAPATNDPKRGEFLSDIFRSFLFRELEIGMQVASQ